MIYAVKKNVYVGGKVVATNEVYFFYETTQLGFFYALLKRFSEYVIHFNEDQNEFVIKDYVLVSGELCSIFIILETIDCISTYTDEDVVNF